MPKRKPATPDDRPTALLLDAPIGPLSPPEAIRAWLKELDQIETRVAPNSDASETIADAREEAELFLGFALERAERDDRPTAVLLCAMHSPFTPPDEIRAFLKELDELEAEVQPGSDAVDTIAVARAQALRALAGALEWENRPKK